MEAKSHHLSLNTHRHSPPKGACGQFARVLCVLCFHVHQKKEKKNEKQKYLHE